MGLLMHLYLKFQHTAARRRLADSVVGHPDAHLVSTHSRPKAAGFCDFFQRCTLRCFNTQPPEGGWILPFSAQARILGFQHTAARRRLEEIDKKTCNDYASFNTQPPEGGWIKFC